MSLPWGDERSGRSGRVRRASKSFAHQAVIAIENVRLFEEVQARNREISEALERETATGEILRAIAGSPTDIQPVLQVVAEALHASAIHTMPSSCSPMGMGSPLRRTTVPSRWISIERFCRSRATGSPVAPLSIAKRCMFTTSSRLATNFLSANRWRCARAIEPPPPRR